MGAVVDFFPLGALSRPWDNSLFWAELLNAVNGDATSALGEMSQHEMQVGEEQPAVPS